MNDFTREEVRILCIWGELYKSGSGISWEKSSSKKNHQNLLNKLKEIFDNYCENNINYGHLTDKHISQWAGYLVEEFPRWRILENILISNPEIEEIFLKMYKKGYQDCKTEGGGT